MKKPFIVMMSTMMLLTLGAIFSAQADTMPDAQSEIMKQMDQDEDGMISIREAVSNPSLLASFGKIDTDGDGKISLKELQETRLLTQVAKQA